MGCAALGALGARAVGDGDDSPMVETQHEPLRPLCIHSHTRERAVTTIGLAGRECRAGSWRHGSGSRACALSPLCIRATSRPQGLCAKSSQTNPSAQGSVCNEHYYSVQVFLIPGSFFM